MHFQPDKLIMPSNLINTPVKILIICLISFNLPGCAAWQTVTDFTTSLMGGEDNSEPPNELMDYEPELEISEIWNEDIGDGYEDAVVKLLPALADGVIYAADREGVVEARNSQDGELIWEVETEIALSSGPGLAKETIILGSSNADVLALSKENGEIVWQYKLTSEVLSTPVVEMDRVIVRTTDGKLFALDENTGEELWEFERTIPALSIRGAGTPVIYEDKVISGFANGKTIALRGTDGKLLWETSVAIPTGRSEVERLVDLIVDPALADGIVYISAYQGGTNALLADDGTVLWRADEISSYSGFALDFNYLYLTDIDSDVWQLDLRNGAALWKQKELHRRFLTAPVVYNDYVVVGDFEGYVHWLSVSDGRQLGREKITSSPIIAQPLVRDNIVYVFAKDGTLAALKAEPVQDQ